MPLKWPAALVRALAASALAAGLACLLLEWNPPIHRETLTPVRIGHLGAHGYAAVLSRPRGWPLLAHRGDTYERRRSSLRLLENGAALAQPHAEQRKVEAFGAGRYLHLRETELYFSSSDNSDPRANGRHYEIESPVRPRPGLTVSLLAFAAGLIAASVAAARVQSAQSEVLRRRIDTTIFVGYALLSLAWLHLVLTPQPLIVPTGDGGNVASIAAGWLHRLRFVGDPVLGTAGPSAFYVALSVLATVALAALLGDVGTAYVVQMLPLLTLQTVGFHMLGRRLFGDARFAVVLALISVPPVYVFGGELWGMLGTPLTRSYAGAALPWLLLLLLRLQGRRAMPFAVMAACGASVYLHPVSAPGLAAGCLAAALFDRPAGTGWMPHLRRLLGAALIFLAMCLPFVIAFSLGAGPAEQALSLDPAVVQDSLRIAAGPQYFDVRMLVGNAVGVVGSRWPVWLLGAVAFVAVPRLTPLARAPIRLLGGFAIGVILGSVGLTALDQWVAHMTGRHPLQIDLVRNVRFVVPILLISCIWLMASLFDRWHASAAARASVTAVCVWILAGWWIVHPTPLADAVAPYIGGGTPGSSIVVSDRQAIARLGALPAGSRILPLAASDRSEGPPELVGLAVRYGALQPVVFLEKDLNLLSYSRSAGTGDWLGTRRRIEALRDAPQEAFGKRLHELAVDLRIDYLLVHGGEFVEGRRCALATIARPVATDSEWHLFALARGAAQPEPGSVRCAE